MRASKHPVEIWACPQCVVDGREREAERNECRDGEDLCLIEAGVPQALDVSASMAFGSAATARAHWASACSRGSRSASAPRMTAAAASGPVSAAAASCPRPANNRSHRESMPRP